MSFIKKYLKSLNFGKEHLYSLVADILTILIIVGLFYGFNFYLKEKTNALGSFSTPEQLQQALISMAPQEMENMLIQIKSILFVFLFGILFLVTASWLIYSYSRANLWNHLLQKKLAKSNYWRWNGLMALLFIITLIYALTALILKLLLLYLSSRLWQNTTFLQTIDNIANALFIIFFFIFVSVNYYSFAEKYKVFESVGETFRKFRRLGSKIWLLFLLSVITAILPFLISLLFQTLNLSSRGLIFFNVIFSLLFLSWLRIYLLKTIHEHHSPQPAQTPGHS